MNDNLFLISPRHQSRKNGKGKFTNLPSHSLFAETKCMLE